MSERDKYLAHYAQHVKTASLIFKVRVASLKQHGSNGVVLEGRVQA